MGIHSFHLARVPLGRALGALARTPAAGLLVSLYGLVDFLRIVPPAAPGARVLSVARHANAKRHVARVASWLEPGACAPVSTRISPGMVVSGLASLLRVAADPA